MNNPTSNNNSFGDSSISSTYLASISYPRTSPSSPAGGTHSQDQDYLNTSRHRRLHRHSRDRNRNRDRNRGRALKSEKSEKSYKSEKSASKTNKSEKSSTLIGGNYSNHETDYETSDHNDNSSSSSSTIGNGQWVGDSKNGPSVSILFGIIVSMLLILFLVLRCWNTQKKQQTVDADVLFDEELQRFEANVQEKDNFNNTNNTNNNHNHSNNDNTDIDTDIDTDIESPNPSPPPQSSSTTTATTTTSPSTVELELKASAKASSINPSVEPRIYSVEGIPIDEVNDDNNNNNNNNINNHNNRKGSSIYIEEKQQQQPIPEVVAEEITPVATAPPHSFNSTSTPTPTPASTSTKSPAPTSTPTTTVEATTNVVGDSITKTIGGWFAS